MKKEHWNFGVWVTTATSNIHYRPDRKAVSKELRDHLDDAYEAGLARGLTDEEANKQALASMGSATEVAAQLAQIYNPFWAYVIQVSQVVLAILLVLSLIPVIRYIGNVSYSDSASYLDFDVYDAASYGEESARVLHHLSQPEVSFSSEAGTFTVTDAAVFTSHDTGKTYLHLQVRQRGLLPWSERKQYFQFFSVVAHFSARDSLGNEYPCWDYAQADASHLISHSVQSGIFTGTHEFWINDFPKDAEFVEILYTRDGRNYILHIDLTGGDRK